MDEQIGSSTLTSKDQKMYVITLRYMFENGTLAQSRDVYSFVETGDESVSFLFDYDKTNQSADGVRIDIWTHFMRGCIIELCTPI